MPYSLRGKSVVRSDTGEVVKTHPTREKALRHLRALKANVQESSPAVLGTLLEGFDPARHPRGFHGRFSVGDLVKFNHPQTGVVTEAQVSGLLPNGILRVQTGVRAPSLLNSRTSTGAPGQSLTVHHSLVEPMRQWQFSPLRGLRRVPLRSERVGR